MINALTDPRRVVRAGYGSTSGLSEAEIEIPRCKSGFASGSQSWLKPLRPHAVEPAVNRLRRSERRAPLRDAAGDNGLADTAGSPGNNEMRVPLLLHEAS